MIDVKVVCHARPHSSKNFFSYFSHFFKFFFILLVSHYTGAYMTFRTAEELTWNE